jgi:hypothetical protein
MKYRVIKIFDKFHAQYKRNLFSNWKYIEKPPTDVLGDAMDIVDEYENERTRSIMEVVAERSV